MAFNKLLNSLDTFSDNFDKYYENFTLESKDPGVLFMDFIGDV